MLDRRGLRRVWVISFVLMFLTIATRARSSKPVKQAGHGPSAQLGEFRELGRAEGTVQLKQVQGLALACAHADLRRAILKRSRHG
jgi:hypothetical protein